MQNSEAYKTDTLTFNSKYLWVVNKDLYPDAYVITQADIDVLNLLSPNPEAALEWLLNK
ncbi:hypothetical protein nACB1_078 [Acinetobacter phage nACB1]|nr:hypothetical protein nACB1_078 [Acinetobacter phage nACB1]